MNEMPFDVIPVAGLLPLVAVATGLTFETAFRVGRRQAETRGKDGSINTVVGSTVGLLAFLLAFTFNLASTRYEAHREANLEEANAIGTAYLRAKLLPEPQRTALMDILREYTDVRIIGTDVKQIKDAVRQSEALHERMWSTAAEATRRPDTNPVYSRMILEALNTVIDDHAVRVHAGGRGRIPFGMWLGLYGITFLAFASVGYLSGLNTPYRSPTAITLVVGFALVLYLIADMDRPAEGMIRVSQKALADTRRGME